jgi:hypothetical protein
MLFAVSTCAEPEEASAILHIFTAHDIRRALQTTPSDQSSGRLELPLEQWSRKYSALNPIVPRIFAFEFRSNDHTGSGHVVFRVSGAGEGPQFYWNVGQVRWSIEKSENEVRLGLLRFCDSLINNINIGGSSPSMRNRAMNWSSLCKIPAHHLHLSSSRRQRSVEQFTLTSLKTRCLGSCSLLLGVLICRSYPRLNLLFRCFHVLRPLVQPVEGVEIVEQCFPILLPEDLREKYINGATICDVHFHEEEGSLLIGTMSEVWAMYYV